MHIRCVASTRRPWWLIGAWLIGLILLFKPWVHGTDPVGYYSWLRSMVFDGDLDTTDEYAHYGDDMQAIVLPGPTGYNRNPYSVGTSILWSPFFLVTHLVRQLSGMSGDGYETEYVFAVGLASAWYALLGLWLSYRIAADLFGARVAAWATLGIWWSTPLLFYMYSHPLMSHANDAFVNAVFVFTWHRTQPDRSPQGWLWLGGALGLAALVRAQNVLLVALPLTEVTLAYLARRPLRAHSWPRVESALRFGLAASVVFLPQLMTWWQTYGTLLPGNPYAADTFDFTSPHFFSVLLSSDRGLFVWSPLVALAIFGLLIYRRRLDSTMALGLTLAWLAQVYLVGSWSAWSGGASFGQRFMVNGTVIYILGLAALLAEIRKRVTWTAIGLSLLACAIWNLLLIAQYIVELIPRSGAVDVGQMIVNQFRVTGIVIERLEHLLAARLTQLR